MYTHTKHKEDTWHIRCMRFFTAINFQARGDDLRKYVYFSMIHRLESIEDKGAICSPVLLYAPPRYTDAVGSQFVPPPNIKNSDHGQLQGSWIDILRAHEGCGDAWSQEELAHSILKFQAIIYSLSGHDL